MKQFCCLPTMIGTFTALSLAAVLQACAAPAPQPGPPAKVEIRSTDGRFQLCVNNQPFFIKGAGVEHGSHEKLAAHGGNSIRTWSTENGRDTGKQFLDRALSNGLYVAMGLDVDHERRGFDCRDTKWVDMPASYHNGAGGLSFADGHAEIKKWRDAKMIDAKTTDVPKDPGSTDLAWFNERSTARQ